MPLKTGKSKEAFSDDVAELRSSGRPERQAVAIAYAQKRRKMAAGGAVDPNNGKARAEVDFAAITPDPNRPAHSEEWNRGMPGGGAVDDPYGNALIDGLAGGIAGTLRPGAVAAAKPYAASVSREELARLSPREILEKLGNSRAEAQRIVTAPPSSSTELQSAYEAKHGVPVETPKEMTWFEGARRPSDLSADFHSAEEARAADLAKVQQARDVHPEDATGVLTPPKKYSEGGAVLAGVPKGTALLSPEDETAILEAQNPTPEVALPKVNGASPSWSRFDPNLRLDAPESAAEARERARREAAAASEGVPADLFGDLAAKLQTQYFANGGTVQPADKEPEEPTEGDLFDRDFPEYSQVPADTGGPDPDFSGLPPAPDFPGQVAPADHAAYQDAKADLPTPAPRDLTPPQEIVSRALAAQQAVPAAPKVGPDTAPMPVDPLQVIENTRQQALAAYKENSGPSLRRGIANGLIAAGKGQLINFDEQDKAALADLNAESDRQRNDYLGTPAALAGRNAAVAGSAESTRLGSLVDSLLGQPGKTAGMSAAEIHTTGPFISAYLQAKQQGDALKQAAALAGLRNAVEQRKVDQAETKLGIDQQNADANMLRAQKAGHTAEDANMKAYLNAVASSRNAPDYAQVQKDDLAIAKINAILEKPHPDTDDIAKLKAELAKVASGGEGSQHLQEEMGRPTMRGRAALAWRYLSGQPTSAGYEDIIKTSIKPYVADIQKVIAAQKQKHERAVFDRYKTLLPPDYVEQERQRVYGEPAAPVAPTDNFSKYGGRKLDE